MVYLSNYQYDASHSKDTIIINSCIRVAQRVIAYELFAREDDLNVSRLSVPYFLHSMLQGTRIDPGSFFSNQLLSAATSSTKRIVIGGLTTPIVRSAGIEPNPDDRVSGYKRLALATFEQMKFCMMERGRICWIYLGNRLMPLPNVDRTTL